MAATDMHIATTTGTSGLEDLRNRSSLTPTLSPRGEGVDHGGCGSIPPSHWGEGQGEGEFPNSLAVLRLQSWLSPAFPIGAYSYSHGLEWAVETGSVHDRESLIDWLEADLRYGSVRSDAIFFCEAWRRVKAGDHSRLLELAELAAAFRGTSELALEASQQGASCLAILRKAWPDTFLDAFAENMAALGVQPALAVVLGAACARNKIGIALALPVFQQSYIANMVTAGMRLIPLGQTDGQLAVAALEGAILESSAEASQATLEDLGSSAFMVDLASMAHETQYTRLFRS